MLAPDHLAVLPHFKAGEPAREAAKPVKAPRRDRLRLDYRLNQHRIGYRRLQAVGIELVLQLLADALPLLDVDPAARLDRGILYQPLHECRPGYGRKVDLSSGGCGVDAHIAIPQQLSEDIDKDVDVLDLLQGNLVPFLAEEELLFGMDDGFVGHFVGIVQPVHVAIHDQKGHSRQKHDPGRPQHTDQSRGQPRNPTGCHQQEHDGPKYHQGQDPGEGDDPMPSHLVGQGKVVV